MGIKYNPITGTFDLVGDASGGGGGDVTSVNGAIGDVVLDATDVGADPTGTAQTLFDTLGDKYVRTTRFESIGSGTSGTVTLPANSTVVLDDFGGTTDAVVATITGGKPNYISAKTAGGAIVATTFDASGNWSFTGTPSAYPVAILYRVRQKLSDFDSTAANIFGNSNVEQVTATDIGLGNVDNTSDATKNAAAVTLTNKTLTSPVINTPTGIVKADVGLGNVDNTSNATERAATATLTNKTLTSPVINSPTGIVKGDVGLGNVDNTTDANKPVSTATQSALDLKANQVEIQSFTASGTFTVPTGAKVCKVFAIGAGGGGASGQVGADGVIRNGGSGGSAGSFTYAEFDATQLGSSVSVTIGAGGSGGAGKVGVGNGAVGVAGGDTTFGTFLTAKGGGGGVAGATSVSGLGGTIYTNLSPFSFQQKPGGTVSTSGGQAGATSVAEAQPTGGGGSGGLPSTGAVRVGSAGGVISGILASVLNVAGGTTSGVAGVAGGNGNSGIWTYGLSIGTGGGGTQSHPSGASANGGNGANYGGGGGGTGAATTESGTGGSGAGGCLLVVVFY